jgi:hypothetical protein
MQPNQTNLKLIAPRLTALALAAAAFVAIGCDTAPKPTPEAAKPTPAAAATSPVSITPSPGEAAEKHPWTTQQILTCTVSQCWQLSGKSEDTFFDIVQDLAVISAKNRDLTLPDDEAAGKKAGEHIKSEAKKDHDALLFAIVDQAVRQVGTEAPAATK